MRAPAFRMEAVSAVTVPEGRRALREEAIGPLMDSIKRLGLQVPIAVRVVDEYLMPDGEIVDGVPLLVAGRHRLEACRRLGMETVPVVEFNDEREARLWEISENLHRVPLTDDQQREQIVEWVALTAEKMPHGAAFSKIGAGRGNTGTVATAAKALGVSKNTVARAIAAESLPVEAKAEADKAGLGTVARAKAAKAPDPVAAVKRMMSEKEAAEARKANRQTDQAIEQIEVEARADWLCARLDLTEARDFAEWLRGRLPALSKAMLREVA
jgi:ParB-like chromosome segregation protein Spo0J